MDEYKQRPTDWEVIGTSTYTVLPNGYRVVTSAYVPWDKMKFEDALPRCYGCDQKLQPDHVHELGEHELCDECWSTVVNS